MGTANDKSYDATHDNLEDDTHQDIHQDSTPSAVILRLTPHFQFVQKPPGDRDAGSFIGYTGSISAPWYFNMITAFIPK